MKYNPGEVYILQRGEYTTTALVTASAWPYKAARITTGPNLKEYAEGGITKGYLDPFTRTDWTAWAEAVAKLTDYLLALPAEVME